jgi:hypothetical protein
MQDIKTFLKENNINFKGDGSGLNSDCVVLSGFALYKDIQDVSELYSAVEELPDFNKDYQSELNRVFEYAQDNNYGDYWNHAEAAASYKY